MTRHMSIIVSALCIDELELPLLLTSVVELRSGFDKLLDPSTKLNNKVAIIVISGFWKVMFESSREVHADKMKSKVYEK